MSDLSELKSLYGHKILTSEEFLKLYPVVSRDVKIVLCHGVFDFVHPGHVRHLAYAKSKGKILVVSITPDGFIDKGAYRPHVSQNLRALNLAAFEMVDFVIIDRNETPYELISELKPNIFAKGSEYGELENPKTAQEIDLVESYGGSVIFTPGDIVFSSTKIINNESSMRLNLSDVLESEGIDKDLLKKSMNFRQKPKVLVIGDTIVDEIVSCTSIGGQTKTPTLSVRIDNSEKYIGGAAIVASHFAAAGADTKFCSVIGDDLESDFVRNSLIEFGVETELINEANRPTTLKKVFLANNYRLLKVDVVDNRPIHEKTVERFLDILGDFSYDIVVFSDFRHGIFTRERINRFVKSIKTDTFKVADSQVASRWGNISEFRGFDLITPNEKEARFSIGDQESTVVNLALKTLNQANAKNIILKLGDKGALSLNADASQSRGVFSIPSLVQNPVDPVGAGDALLAYGTLALANTGDHKIANLAGSIAASMSCETEGNVPITINNLLSKLSKIV